MTELSQQMDSIIEDIVDNKYQFSESQHAKALLKIDLEKIYENVEQDAEYHREYVMDLEKELAHVHDLLEKLNDSDDSEVED